MEFPKILKIAVVEFSNLKFSLTSDGVMKFSGVEGRLLGTILDALHVIPEIVTPHDFEWGSLKEDGNWTGMIGLVHRGEADIALSSIAQSFERMRDVDFSMSYTMTDTTFAVERPGEISKGFVFMLPFSLEIWIITFAFIIAYPLLIRLFLSNNSYAYLWLNTVGNILKQPSEIANKPWYNRIIQATWLLFAFSISCFYSAVLLSFLTFPIEGDLIRSFKQLSEAVTDSKLDCYVVRGTLTISKLLNLEDEHLKRLGESIIRNNWLEKPKPNCSFNFCNAAKTGSAYLSLRELLEKYFGLRLDMYISKDSLGITPVAIAINPNFCCGKKLDDVLYRLIESGIYRKFVQDESLKSYIEFSKNATFVKDNFKPLLLHELIGAFMMLVFGLTISCFVFICEVLYFKRNSSTDSK
nr:glutamate receptor ionotropic, delta-1-like [Parasteatoda tepidariorum]